MIIYDNLIKKIGSVDIKEIQKLLNLLNKEFSQKWVQRTLKVMDTSFVLKAISPTKLDRCENSDLLTEVCAPFFKPFVGPNEKIIYLDVSCLPKGARSLVHIDYAWIHVLSRRVRIPLQTNEQAIYAALDEQNKIHSFNLKVGSVYETNNQTLHAAANFGNEDRWHLVADIIDYSAYEFLEKMNYLDKPYSNKWCNFYFNTKIQRRIDEALIKPASVDI